MEKDKYHCALSLKKIMYWLSLPNLIPFPLRSSHYPDICTYLLEKSKMFLQVIYVLYLYLFLFKISLVIV